ncbi:transmembrane protein 164-like [Dysidea avara]|uniref:transmembrane protein 164-like n=1 Tax=Dysidea avara TaxID=196820 RepID=UPI003320152E
MATFWEALYGGINPEEVPGHGGAECVAYLSNKTKIFETCLSTTIMLIASVYAFKRFSLPAKPPPEGDHFWKGPLLALLSAVLGLQIGYKISSGQLLYMLNPCHFLTIVEIYLLASKPTRFTLSILRMLVHYVYCALVAIVFPETGGRVLFGELVEYWVQHILIFAVIPPYLIHIWGVHNLEPLNDWSWACFAGIVFGIQHHYVMQPVAIVSHVNLNFILCPATKDPFRGPHYRTWAVFHQTASLLIMGKLYTIVVKLILPKSKKE